MPPSDIDLLHRYASTGSQEAFTTLVTRHIDLVYSAALRQVRLPHLAQEVVQSVFIELSRSAAKFPSHSLLTPWLYHVTRRRSIDLIRSESRRRLREQIACEINEMNATSPDWTQIEPLLDEAMAALPDLDRTAILLRYFENKPLRELGCLLGISDDAAQKRVSRALGQLRHYFAKRNIPVAAATLAAGISTQAIQAAPASLVATVTFAALLTPVTVHSAAAGVTTAIAMTTIQKALIAATLTLTVAAGAYQTQRASQLREQLQALQQQQDQTTAQNNSNASQLDDALQKLAILQSENDQLRAHISSLKTDSAALSSIVSADKAAASDPAKRDMESWMNRVDRLKRRVAQHPELTIPEMKFLTDKDWLDAAKGELNSEQDYRHALSALRDAAENAFVSKAFPALQKFISSSGGQFPTDLSQLQPYFKSPIDAAILQRWQIVPASQVPNMHVGGDSVITQKSAIDPALDNRVTMGSTGYGVAGGGFNPPTPTVDSGLVPFVYPVSQAYAAAHNGADATDPSQLLPYATTAEQQAAIRKVIQAVQTSRNAPTP
jgi:RNA polymerase sigma factor (sigma-70 family)